MKKTFFILLTVVGTCSQAQETNQKQIPQITVSGEGKVKVTPDQACITIAIENKGTKAVDVKKLNDSAVEKVIQFIKSAKIPTQDVLTQRVSLNPTYDYEKKKQEYTANQTIIINLKDLSKYEQLMEGIVDAGANRIDNVEFKSSKLAQYQSDARKAAITDAKKKAEDYVSVLGQKIGKALLINDNSQTYYPQPMYKTANMNAMADGSSAPRETLAVGDIDITANVTVSFILE